MTKRASDPAAERRRPLARLSLLALPGGVTIGAQVGVWYSLISTVPILVLDPAQFGGSGSVGLTISGAMIGFVVGALFGVGVGAATAGVLALAWSARWATWVVTALGSLALSATAIGLTLLCFGFDPATLLIPVLGSARGVAGVILLSWVGQQRPRDYGRVLAERERQLQQQRASASD